jgi:TetR/AcrR family transcriptional regulator, transcriptional repressor for nem operon
MSTAMPPPKKKTVRTEAMAETREKLIAAGAELFAKQGLDAPSLDAICDRAGFTRGAFYVHFKDRDDFLVAVMERVGLPFLDSVLGDADGSGAPPTLETVVARFLGAVVSGRYPLTSKNGPRPHQLLDACARSEKIRARYVGLVADSIARLSRVIQASQEEGTVRADVRAEDVSTVLLAAIIGAQTMIELKAPLDLAGAATSMVKMMGPSRER